MKRDGSDVASLKTVLTQMQALHEKISQEQHMAINMGRQANFDFEKEMTIFKKSLKELSKKIHKETKKIHKETRSKSDGIVFITSNIAEVKCRITEKGQIVGEILFDFYPFYLENFVKENKLDFVKKAAALLKIPKEYIDIRLHMIEDAK